MPQRNKKLYNSTRWRKMRKILLESAGPGYEGPTYCQSCLKEGLFNEATEIDHIEAKQHYSPEEFYNVDNLQPLCRPCHRKKTLYEDTAKEKKKIVFFD